jgi:hypothetical protein
MRKGRKGEGGREVYENCVCTICGVVDKGELRLKAALHQRV